MRTAHCLFFGAFFSAAAANAVAGTYKDDIGYTRLYQALNGNVANGAGVNVIQVEASTSATSNQIKPDPANAAFSKITFHLPADSNAAVSSHATGVGQIFYGASSTSNGIKTVDVYSVNSWLNAIGAPSVVNPPDSARVVNNSWVGAADNAQDSASILSVLDRLADRRDLIDVAAMNNSATTWPLLADLFNAITVGRSDGHQDTGTHPVNAPYNTARTAPDLVAPNAYTSDSTPMVASAAAMLTSLGHADGLTLSKGVTQVAGVGQVYDAEQEVTIKAALMAGADRSTNNASYAYNVQNYRAAGYATANGLDSRYGAGQLDEFNSYEILLGGEHKSVQAGNTGDIGQYGFDYAKSFATNGNNFATYRFTDGSATQFAATLAWDLTFTSDSAQTGVLRNLDLSLFDVTRGIFTEVSKSAVDNTQNIWASLTPGDKYQLQVTVGDNQNVSVGYALAWRFNSASVSATPKLAYLDSFSRQEFIATPLPNCGFAGFAVLLGWLVRRGRGKV